MSELLEYDCPACGGRIKFDSVTQQMKCPYCDTVFELETLKKYDDVLKDDAADDMRWENHSDGQWQSGETEGMSVYTCKSCGGEIVGDANTAASSCPFCDNPIVMSGKFAGDLRPDYIIPFKLDKKAAKEALKNHLKDKRLLPRVFKTQNHIDEIKSIYVPFWLFDADADVNVRYKATKERRWNDNEYDYTEKNYYSVYRAGNIHFDHVPVDSSTKLDDTLMESLEPFDFSAAVDFQTAYLSGYLADRYDVSPQESISRANERVKRTAESAFAASVQGFNTIVAENTSIKLKNGVAKYALYPVWLLNTVWNGNKYVFAMNGQTGKFVGDLPIDKNASRKWMIGLTAACSFAVFAISFLVWLF